MDALLAPLAANRVSEPLPISAAALLANPTEYRGRILADHLLAPADLPTFDNSQMDGYAVSWFDLVTASPDDPVRVTIADQIAAGDGATTLLPGTAAPIMTGAPVPPGADAIVPIEQALPPHFQPAAPGNTDEGESDPRADAPGTPTVSFIEPVTPGTFIRRAGSDVSTGDVLLTAGSVLGPAQLGVITGTGLTEVDVLRRIRVLLVSTGHEIRDAGTTLAAGQIFDSNSISLSLALVDAGCEVTAVPCRSDDADALLSILSAHAAEVDLIITIGGVSAGAREVVRDALGPLGVDFVKVAMQPGGPQGLGVATIPLSPATPTASRPAFTSTPDAAPPSEATTTIAPATPSLSTPTKTSAPDAAPPSEATAAISPATPSLSTPTETPAPDAAPPSEATAAISPATPSLSTPTETPAPDARTELGATTTLPVLCLPGNPVSALVSFEMFVRHALRKLALLEPNDRIREVAMIASAADSPSGTYQVRRGFVGDDGTVALIGGPSSHLLHSYASSNALVHIPADVEHLDAGDPVMVWRIDD
ncbi:hypothetical protein GCM10011399_34190 [Subtercola lobariae]|uniref:Molybdopterin molybdenumtransferase n=1 Tax=Subtercola lobariae TaxID=1588641 RepID=A0A917BD88_9MICO|nr:hypothetical protein GCM10011399_34190 [Subtercola lobariae]